MKNVRIRIGTAVLALVMCIGLLVSCGEKGITLESVQKDPYTAVMSGSEKYADALGDKYGDVFEVFEQLTKGVGTYEFKMSVPNAADIGVNAVVDAANGTYSGKATAGIMGFTTEAKVWGDKNNIALNVPVLTGDKSYGVKFDTLASDLEKSELLSEILGVTVDELKSVLETEVGITVEELVDMFSFESWRDAFNEYVVESKAYIDGKDAVVAESYLKVGGNDVSVITVEYTFTKDDCRKLIEMGVEIASTVCGKVLAAAGIDLGELIAEAQTDSGADEIIDTGITLKYYLNKSNGAVVASDFVTGETAKISCVYGDPSDKLDMSVSAAITVDGEVVEITAAIKETSGEGKSGIEASVVGKAAGEEHTAKLVAERSDADGKYEVKLTADDEELASANGVITFNSEELAVTVEAVTVAGETVNPGLSFSAKVGGTVEAVPEYVNITDATLSEIGGLADTIGALIGGIGYEEDCCEDEDYSDFYDDIFDGIEGAYDDISGGASDAYDDISDGIADMYDSFFSEFDF